MSQAVGSHAIKFECGICQKEFSTSWCLQIHIQTHNEKKTFDCQECGESFPDVTLLCEHLKVHILGENVETCQVCGKEYPSSEIEAHKRSHIFKPGLTCNICGKSFGSRQVLVLHLRSHGAKDPFKCQICGLQFASRNSFSQHWNSHLSQKGSEKKGVKGKKKGKHNDFGIFTKDGKRLKCVLCNKSITSKAKAYQHAKSHAIKKRSIFDTRKPCQSEDNLESKKQSGRRTRQTQNLKQAVPLRKKTPVSDVVSRLLSCSECDEHFRDIDELQKHKIIHIEELSARLLRLSSPPGKICKPLKPKLVLDAVQSIADQYSQGPEKQRNLQSESMLDPNDTDDESLVLEQPEDMCQESFVSLSDIFASPEHRDHEGSKTNIPNLYKMQNVRVVLERLDESKIKQLRTRLSSQRLDDKEHKCADSDNEDDVSLLSTVEDASTPNVTSFDTEPVSMDVEFDDEDDVVEDTGDISDAVNAAMAACADVHEKTSVAVSEGGPGAQSTYIWSVKEPQLDSVDDVEGVAVSSENRLKGKNNELSHLSETEENKSKSVGADQEETGIQSSINGSPDIECKSREETNETQSSTIRMNYRKVKNKYVCSICEKSFESSQAIYRHVYEHLKKSKGVHTCTFCGQSRERRSHLKAHESLHIKLHATIGGVRKEDVQKIKEHTFKDRTGFSCKVCSLTFKLRIDVYRHVFSHFFSGTNNTDNSGIGDTCETKPRENEKKILLHEALKYFVAKDGAYTCLKCETVLQSKKTAYVHYKRHVMSAPFSCSVCPYAFFTRHHRDRHMKTHKFKRNLKCNSEVLNESVVSNAPYASTAAGEYGLEKTSSQDSAAVSEGDPANRPTSVCSTEESHLDPVDDVEEDAVSSEDRLKGKNNELCPISETEENESKSVGADQEETGIQSLINGSPDIEFKPRKETNETQSSTIRMNYKKVENKYVCSICEKSFESSQAIYSHVYEHLRKSKGVHTCTFCGQSRERRSHLDTHESLHIKLHATIGGVRKEDVQKIKEHTLKDRTGFSCKVCSLTFKLRIEVYRHVFSHFFPRTNRTDKCSIGDPCETSPPKETKKKILPEEALKYFAVKNGTYTCSKCEKVLHCKKTALVHYKRHEMSFPFSCSVCSCATNTRQHLERHMKTHNFKRNFSIICNGDVMNDSDIFNAPNAATAAGDDDLEKTSSQDSAAVSEGCPTNRPTSVCSTEESHLDPVDDVEEDAVASDFSIQDDPGFSDDCVKGNEDIVIGTSKHSDESCTFKCKFCDFSSENRLEAKNHKLSHLPEAEENESKSVSGDKDEPGIQSLINDSTDTELKSREEANETQSSTISMNYRKVEDKYVCSICEKSFENSQTIYRHVYEHLKKSKGLHICSFCGQSRERRSHLEAHESLHIKLHATIGGVRKEDVQKIKEHTLKDRTGFSCKVCSLTFKLRIEVYRHVFSHFFSGTNNTDKSGIGDHCETKPRENEKKILLHEALKYFVAKDGAYTCLKCETVLQSKKTAYVHYKRHVMSAPFSCSVCPYATFTRHHLDQHLKTHLCKRNLKFIRNGDVMNESDISNALNAATAANEDGLEKTPSQDSAPVSEGGPMNQPTSVCSTEESHLDPVDDVEEDAVASDISIQDDPGFSDDCVKGNEDIEIGRSKHSDESCTFKCKFCDFSSENRLEAKNHKLSHPPEAEENESKSVSGDKDEPGIQSLITDSTDIECKPREEANETQSSTIRLNYRKVEDKYVCSICEKSFENSQTIYSHVYEHLRKSKGLHICSFCGLACDRKTHLDTHESLHIKLHATIGGVRKEDVQKIKEHTLKDRTGFSCKVCSLTFKLRIDVYRHVFNHFFPGTNNTNKSGIGDPSETVCMEKKKIILQESLKYFVVKDGVYTCSKCETVIHSKKAAFVHYKRHVMFPPFSCSVCPYAAYTRHHLDKHMKTHSYRRKKDAENVKQFTIKEALAYIQVEEKGFRCKLCNNILKTHDIAIAHVVRHNQKGRFRCEVCGHRTHTRHHLKRHAKRHIQKRQLSNTMEEVVPDSGDQLCNLSHIDSHDKGVKQESRLKMSNPQSSLLSTSGSQEIMPHLENINYPENANPECSGECTALENQTTSAIKTASQSQYSNNEFCPDQDTQNNLESSFSKAVKSTLSDDTRVKGSPTSTQSLALTEGERKNMSTGFETTGNSDAMDIDDSGNRFPSRRRSPRMLNTPNISYKDSADTIDEEDDSDLDSDFHCEDSDHSSRAGETEDEEMCSANEESNQPACLPSTSCGSEDGSRQEPATETEEQNNECERGITSDSTPKDGYFTKKDDQFECNICMKTFANRKRCHAHISYHHLDQLCCPKCSFQTTSKTYMLKHLQKHNCAFKETFCCKICKDSFKTFYDLSSHIDTHTTEEKMEVLKYLECGTCGEICKTSMLLFSHQLGHLEKFQCEECKSEFKSAQELENHLIEEGHYKCDQCDNVFTSFVSLDDHLKIIHKSSFYKKQKSIKKNKLSSYICGQCYEIFQTKKDLYLHKMQKHGSEEKDFNCDVCYENFTKLHLLTRHKLVHASLEAIGIDSTTGISGSVKLTKMVPCTICSKTYPTITKLRDHLKIHEEKQFVCDVCGLAFLGHNYLLIHEKLHKNIKPYHCKQCPRKYVALTLLKSHIKNSHSGKKERKYVKCDVCSKLLCKSYLHTHMKTHLKRSKNFPCSQCGKMFYSKNQVKSHEKTHEERSFVCDECGLSLKSKYVLKYHKQTHTDDRPFVCEECGSAFRMKATLEKHMLTHTKVKDHVCEFCNKRFALPGTLKNHRNIHTGEKPYKCKVCEMCFSDRWAKFKHEKSHAVKDS